MLAIVPLKLHSERLPNKNFTNFHGKPLFMWILDTLRECDIETVVNAENDEVAQIVRGHFDGEIIIRPEALKGDYVTGTELISYTLECVKGNDFIYTHATNPLLRPETIKKAVEIYKTSEFDSLFTVTRLDIRAYTFYGKPINHDPTRLSRSQDVEPIYEDNSCLYIFSRDIFLKTGCRIGHNPCIMEIDKEEAVDIDTKTDWLFAKEIHKERIHDLTFENLCFFDEELKKLGVDWRLSHGVLLGAIRENRFLPGDYDVDIVINDYDNRQEEILKHFENLGCEMKYNAPGHHRINENCIFFYRDYGSGLLSVETKYALSPELRLYLPKVLFDKTEYVEIRGRKFPTFSPAKKYLEWVYGDWKKPKRQKFNNWSTKRVRFFDNAKNGLKNFEKGL